MKRQRKLMLPLTPPHLPHLKQSHEIARTHDRFRFSSPRRPLLVSSHIPPFLT